MMLLSFGLAFALSLTFIYEWKRSRSLIWLTLLGINIAFTFALGVTLRISNS